MVTYLIIFPLWFYPIKKNLVVSSHFASSNQWIGKWSPETPKWSFSLKKKTWVFRVFRCRFSLPIRFQWIFGKVPQSKIPRCWWWWPAEVAPGSSRRSGTSKARLGTPKDEICWVLMFMCRYFAGIWCCCFRVFLWSVVLYLFGRSFQGEMMTTE